MKRSSLLLAALALPLAAFAADTTVTKVDGDGVTTTTTTTGTTERVTSKVTIGTKVFEGQSIDCGDSSSAEIKLPNGGTLALAPGTRILFRSIQNGTDPKNYAYEIVLLRGSISGDAGPSASTSSFNIAVTVGVADVSKSQSFTMSFAPINTANGTGEISSAKGTIQYTSTKTGDQTVIGQLNTPNAYSFDSAGLTYSDAVIKALQSKGTTPKPYEDKGSNGTPSDTIEKKTWVMLPDFSRLVISPNGNQ